VAIVAVEGERPGPEEILDWCRERLSKFKVPTIVALVDELPKTSIGKVRKSELRKDLTPPPQPAGGRR